jgi:hypothetical protein
MYFNYTFIALDIVRFLSYTTLRKLDLLPSSGVKLGTKSAKLFMLQGACLDHSAH